jgi:hypothetical protein
MSITTIVLLAVVASSSVPTKESVSVAVDGAVRCQWTSIKQPDGQSRVLYKDDVGHMLVIRRAPDPQKPAITRMSIADKNTGEDLLITTDTARGTVTFALGGSRKTVDSSSLQASESKAQGATLAAKSSLAFQDALKRLAIVGCADNELQVPVRLYSAFLYDRSVCNGLAPLKVETSNAVERFNAKAVEPSDFEEQFGRNYYE